MPTAFQLIASSLLFIGGLAAGVEDAVPDLDAWTIEHFQLAREAEKKNLLDTAEREYGLILAKHPEFAEARLNLGIVYQLQNRYAAAIETFQAALSQKPGLIQAQVLLGISYYMTQDFEASLKPLGVALKANPKEKQAGLYLALALLGLDRPEAAARQLRETARCCSGDVEIAYHLGEAYAEGVRQSGQVLLKASRDSALYPWALALAAEYKNDSTSAVLSYLKALSLDPDIAPIYFRLAGLFGKLGVSELSRAAMSRYAVLRPGPLAQQHLANEVARQRASRDTVASRNDVIVDAGELQRKWTGLPAVRTDPGMPGVADAFVNAEIKRRLAAGHDELFKTGVLLYELEDFPRAAEKLKVALDKQPTDWLLAYVAARAYMSDGAPDSAEAILERQSAPHLEIPSVALLKMQVQTELSLRYFQFVLANQADSIRARMIRAKSFSAALEPDQAIAQYREVLKAQPDLLNVHLAIAQIYLDQLNWTAAAEELTRELRLSPDNGMALALLGHAYAELGDADGAIKVLEPIIRRYPNDGTALADLGKAYLTKGEMDKAIIVLERAVAQDPSQHKLHYKLFRLYRAEGKTELASSHLKLFEAAEAKRKKTDLTLDH